MGKKKKFYTYFYVKNLPFPFLLFLYDHILRARLRRMLWVIFNLIKSVDLAKMSQKLQMIIDVQTDEHMKGQMDAKQFLYKSSNSSVAKFYVFNISFQIKVLKM